MSHKVYILKNFPKVKIITLKLQGKQVNFIQIWSKLKQSMKQDIIHKQ